MQHTTNYNLNQWEDADRVTRADVNADNAKLDAALTGLNDTIAANASPLVKLLDYTTTEEAASFSVDVSALALGDYPLLFMLLDSPKTSTMNSFWLTINHDNTDGHYRAQGSVGLGNANHLGDGSMAGLFVLRPQPRYYLHCRSYVISDSHTMDNPTGHSYYLSSPDSVETFDFTTTNNHNFGEGTRVTIWALRR